MTKTKLPPPPPPLRGSPVPLIVLGVAWLLATPFFFILSIIVGGAWLGQTPSAEDVARSRALAAAAIATGVIGPAVGSVLALVWQRRLAAGLLGGGLLITLGAVVRFQLV